MAGHNKWSKIKRQKAVTDARRSKVWARITRDIMVAAREGGGDPGMNARLALAVEKAKQENMPKDNITRAIKRGTGEIQGADYEEVAYEGYAPNGIAVFVETLTDNTNRTVADLRAMFSKAGGSLGNSGSVAFLFDRKGIFEIKSEGLDELELFELVAEAGAEDLTGDEDQFVVTTPVESFGAVQSALDEAGITPEEASLQRIPTMTKQLEMGEAQKVAALLEKIEEHQDVQAVYSTLEFDDELVEALG
ncbi:MAG: YebC/PmpR family DNA-binding transcriptional regulator [Rhodothermales bacterium]|nr:YebC/PmpR family DNA-binding transcriptional regulator [Rhodothermales bacterium]MBO6778992.1 YebC/PmpR family DNA-binding transcriptional regulator [Rhodothermales bacterium]